ncbi:uncharacterized protein LOC128963508 [Oppia nitens]|uniref:uncharacterized protein LOC128963508 n=1 Tax=Oppia nitens TaxID=1686743 RepID=UPI0023D9991F|nr:uncharacterized protein LOC128963508 [Oppia nitens]
MILTNVALNYWIRWTTNYSKINSDNDWSKYSLKTCYKYPPSIEKIAFNNIYWQSVIIDQNTTYYAYNAYYDNRENMTKVRIIGVTDHFAQLVNQTFWCLLYFEGKKRAVLSKVTQIDELAYNFGNYYKRKGYYLPTLLSCDIPISIKNMVPSAVAIKINNQCKSEFTNYLRVIYERPESGNKTLFGVCVRALYYYNIDFSVRLIEWLELQKILGANKVYLYAFTTNNYMDKVLNYYTNLKFIEWRYTTHCGHQLNNIYLNEVYMSKMGDKMLPQETLELNDCFYRNMYKHTFLAVIDIDEVIVPLDAYDWPQMMDQIYNSLKKRSNWDRFASYLFTQTRFYNQLISNQYTTNDIMYTMRHLYRANFTMSAPKSFQLTKNAKVVWNHTPLQCIINKDYKDCPIHFVDKQFGYLLHYRPGIHKPTNCTDTDLRKCAIYDPLITKYNDILNKNMRKSLTAISKVY